MGTAGLLLAACVGSHAGADQAPPPADDLGGASADAHVADEGPDAGAPPELVIGTGREQFEPIEDDTELIVVRRLDARNTHFIPISLRATRFSADDPMHFLALHCTRVRDGEEVCERTRIRQLVAPSQDPDYAVEMVDQNLVLQGFDLAAVRDEEIEIRVHLQDQHLLSASGMTTARVGDVLVDW